MNQAGILSRLKKQWLELEDKCSVDRSVAPVSLANALALLLIIPFGVCASFILLMLECLLYRWGSRVLAILKL